MDMKTQRWGMEIEMTGLSRDRAAAIVAECLGSHYEFDGGYYGKYSVLDTQGRKWTLMYDGSIIAENEHGSYSNSDSLKVELVSPICSYADVPTLQNIVCQLRQAGAISDPDHCCGIHIHVDASPFDAQKLRNLCNIMYCKEDLIYKALQVDVAREDRYCKKVDEQFLAQLNRIKPGDLSAVERIWYGGSSRRDSHYDNSRYHCLNLHAVFQKGTVEFRLFNGTLDPEQIRSYLTLTLAVTTQALNQISAGRQKTQSTNEKYTFRTWLLRLGLIGKEFELPRRYLLEHLEGNIAWKDPAQAERQRERMRQKRELELTRQETSEPQMETNLTDSEENETGFSMCMR